MKIKHTHIGRLRKIARDGEGDYGGKKTDPTPLSASVHSKLPQRNKKKKLYLGDFNSSATSLKKKEILSARSQQKLPLVINTPKLDYKSKTAMKEKEAIF